MGGNMLWLFLPRSGRCLNFRTSSRSFSFTPNTRLSHLADNVASPPSFRAQVARTSEVKSFSQHMQRPSVRTQVLFTVGATVAVYGVAARWTNTDTFYWTNMLQEAGSVWQTRSPSNDEMRRARYFDFGKTLQTRLTFLKDVLEGSPQAIRNVVFWSYIQVAQPILDATEGRRVCWAIGAANALVWLAWQFPRLQPVMKRSFVHSPLSGRSYTLLTSVFSHRRAVHLAAILMALPAFGPGVNLYFEEVQRRHGMREATLKWHLAAFVISAGVYSGLLSHVIASRLTYPRLVSRLSAALRAALSKSTPAAAPAAQAASAEIRTSHGMAGAVYAAWTLTALAYPDTELATVPWTLSVSSQGALGAALALDVIGIWRGWRRFNHWAHLGGALYGAWYWAWGHKCWIGYRIAMLGELPVELANKPPQA